MQRQNRLLTKPHGSPWRTVLLAIVLCTAVLGFAPARPAAAAPPIPQAPTLESITEVVVPNANPPSRLRITWSLVPDATDYMVWTSPNPGTGPYSPLYQARGIASSVIIIDMNSRNPWYFTVTAENSSGVSPRSNEIASSFPYGAQMFYTASPTIGDESIGVHWAGDSFFVSKTLRWGTAPGAYTESVTLGQAANYTMRGLTNGTRYYFKLTAIDENGAAWAAAESSAIPGLATTLAASPGAVSTGNAVTATWTALAFPSATDWIGLYATSAAGEESFVSWRYTNGTGAGSVALTIPFGTPPGTTYELRLFAGNGYTRLARSGPFAINAGVAPVLTASPGTHQAGGTVAATWSAVPHPSVTDWIGLYPDATAADTSFLGWRYTTGTAGGTVTFSLPVGLPNSGTYELRLYSNGTYTRLAASAPITIGGATPTTVASSATTVPAGTALPVSWTGVTSPSATDWIGLYATDAAGDGAYVAWRYTSGTSSGTVALTVPVGTAEGTTYELRLFRNNGYTKLATSSRFAITAPTPPSLSLPPSTITVGLPVNVTWSNIASPTAKDWIGLYATGAADSAFLGWQYTTGTSGGTMSFTIPETVDPGSGYELRLFSNDGFTRLATKGPITIAPGVTRSLVATTSNLTAGGPVTANWSGLRHPTLTDWIGLYRSGAADSEYLAWSYTTGTGAGNVTFTIPAGTPPGPYELRLFANDTYTRLAVSQRLTIS